MKYTGHFSREAYAVWAGSRDGAASLDRLAAQGGFALFGRKRAADRRVWRQLNDVARADAVATVLRREVYSYLVRIDPLVYAEGLPSIMIDLRRLIVIPRVMVSGEACRRMVRELHVQPAFIGLPGGESLRRWFVLTVLESLASSVVEAHPSVRHPLPAGDGWMVVGVNNEYQWQKPLHSLSWPGHYIVLEVGRAPLTRSIRSAVTGAIAGLEASLPSLSYVDRTEILKRATESLERRSTTRRRHVRFSTPS
ncbi:MAG TPA: hypothetical protein VKB50_08635 [Vicinamibacterales bacterium]|nr:hypothetical protein [Vicinamibacterales bacterium]